MLTGALLASVLVAPLARGAAAAADAASTPASAAAAPSWQVAGQQGQVRFVIVPMAEARDRTAYMNQVQQLCEPDRTCFLNFYTNPTGAPVALPLPDAIDHEATAIFRRSMKRGAESFQWSCRMGVALEPCF
jgi:hypothetical protein